MVLESIFHLRYYRRWNEAPASSQERRMKLPQDSFPYPQDPRSQPLASGLQDGGYAYVQDANGLVFGVPDGPHLHPKILGGSQPALYAADLTIRGGNVVDVTN